jgi:hypothetical protein
VGAGNEHSIPASLLLGLRDPRFYFRSKSAMTKAAFNKKKTLFTRKLDLYLRNKLVKYYIWSIALSGDETWTLRKVDQKYLENFEI